jgi:Ricin-type beta-trefoil lectin domain
MIGMVTAADNANSCVTKEPGGNLKMAACTGGSENLLWYEYGTDKLHMADGSGCVDYDPGTDDVYVGTCLEVTNQRWWLDSSNRLRSYHHLSGKCLGDTGTDLRMQDCVSSWPGVDDWCLAHVLSPLMAVPSFFCSMKD